MDYDVIIVGSGPAGSSAAASLYGSDLKVAVIERLGEAQFARYHDICGCGIGKDILRYKLIEKEDIRNHVKGIEMEFPDGKRIKMGGKGFIIDRPSFLRRIKEKCQDRIDFIKDSVLSIEHDGTMYTLHTSSGREMTCRYLIGADGAFSIVRKEIFGTRPISCIPVTKYIVKGKDDNKLLLRCGPEFKGKYDWIFPCGDDLSISSTRSAELSGYVTKGTRFIPTGGLDEIVKGNAIVIGDAAAMPNPISYGGLKIAIISGKMAADAVIFGEPKIVDDWWKNSGYSNKRFLEIHGYIETMTKEDYDWISNLLIFDHMWLDGIAGCIRHPKLMRKYLEFHSIFKYGW